MALVQAFRLDPSSGPWSGMAGPMRARMGKYGCKKKKKKKHSILVNEAGLGHRWQGGFGDKETCPKPTHCHSSFFSN